MGDVWPLSGQIVGGDLVLHLLLPWEEDGFVSGPEVKTALPIEALGRLVRFVYQQAD